MDALERRMDELAASGFQFGTVPVNGVAMHYARKGRGTPLVLLHGWPEFWYSWHKVMDRLGGDFDLIAPDLRGFGATGKGRAGVDATADASRHADDIRAFADALGLQRFGIAGGDVGSYVMQAFSRKYAERLTGAFYFCTIYPGIGPRYGQPSHLIEVWYQYFQQLPLAAKVIGSSRDACRAYIGYFLDHWSGDDPRVFAADLEIYVDNFLRNDNLQGGFDWYAASGATRVASLEGKLPKPPIITVRSGLLWGRRDPLVPIEWADKLGEYFADYTIAFADAGHFVPYEAPDHAAQAIKAFFTP